MSDQDKCAAQAVLQPRISASEGRRLSAVLVRSLRDRPGLLAKIANRCSLEVVTVRGWTMVPLRHVFSVAAAIRIPAEEIRPDFFRLDPLRRHPRRRKRPPTYSQRRKAAVDLSPQAEAMRLNDARRYVTRFLEGRT